MSLDRIIILALRDSQASKRKEKMMQPKNIHLPIVKGTLMVDELPDSERMFADQ